MHDGAPLVVVEGYVDVIAMVDGRLSRRRSRRSAPRSPRISSALLWKMADEPILCFDGDKAGQRAAYRAVDMALPRLKPGKSLRFAMLPDGQDPDDLVRSGGREAIAEVLGGARPLGEMLWRRETEAASLRHAGAPRRASRRASTRWCAASATNRCANIIAQDFQRAAARS